MTAGGSPRCTGARGIDMGEVVYLPVETSLDVPASRLRDGVPWDDVGTAIVITLEDDGDMTLYGTTADLRTVLYMCQKVAHKVLSGDYGE